MGMESFNGNVVEAQKNYEKTADQEKTFANHVGWTFWYDGPIAGTKNLKNRLTSEEIIEADARRMDELKSKSELNVDEQAELEMRERGDLFYKTRYKKRALPNWGGFMANGMKKDEEGYVLTDENDDIEEVTGSVFKEVYEKIETVEGVVDGKKVTLEKSKYDLSEKDLAELDGTEEGRDKIAEFQQYQYFGEIGGEEISSEEAERLFNLYTPFAQKRSDEIESLRAEKVN